MAALTLVYNIQGSNFTLVLPILGGTISSINWGDGTTTTGTGNYNADKTHTFLHAGTYVVSILGTGITNLFSPVGTGAHYLTACNSFGEIGLISLTHAFASCGSLVTVPSSLPMNSSVTDMSNMFYNAISFNQDISSWNVSNVTNMSNMFNRATTFNGNIGNWNVSSVTDMNNMFNHATAFNQSLNSWDVSSVTNMDGIFADALAFNGTIGNWDVSSVTNMVSFFSHASSFNKSLNSWDVSNVVNMQGMFSGAQNFNQDLNSWNVSNVTNMGNMFWGATAFNGNISNWNVSNVSNINSLFLEARAFNQNISGWNVSGANDTAYMFSGAYAFNQDIGNWNVTNITNMAIMFADATSFNQNLNNWNVSNVYDMSQMFSGATSFDGNISNWNVSNVTSMVSMFNGATSFNQNIGNWNVSIVTNMDNMFSGATSFDQNLGNWNVSNVNNFNNVFNSTTLSTTNYNSTLNGWSNLNVKQNVTFGCRGLVYSPNGLTGRDTLSNTYGWVFIGDAFVSTNTIYSNISFTLTVVIQNGYDPYYSGSYSLSSNDLSPSSSNFFNDGNGTKIFVYPNLIFTSSGSNKLVNLNRNNGGEGEEIEVYWSQNYSFDVLEGPKTLTLVYNLQGSNFTLVLPILGGTISNINWGDSTTTTGTGDYNTDKTHTFTNAGTYLVSILGTGITNLSYSSPGATGANYLRACNNFGEIGLTNLANAFANCGSLVTVPSSLPINSTVTDMSYMFYNASSFNQDISSWNVSNVTNMGNMFDFSALSTTNYNTTLNGWSNLNVQPNLTIGCRGLVYSPNGLTGHDTLSNTYGWVFVGDAFVSTNTIYSYISFTLTVVIQNGYNPYYSGSYILSSNDLSPSSSNFYNDGNGTKIVVYPNVIFTSSGSNKLVNYTNNDLVNVNYSFNVLDDPATFLTLVYNIQESNFTLCLPILGGTISSINWGDSTTTTGTGDYNTDKTHTFTNAGTYLVSILGTGITNISYSSNDSPPATGANYLTACNSFGEIGLTNLSNAFANCGSLVTVPSSLPINSTVTDMSYMFSGATSFDQNLGNWNVSNVYSFYDVFNNAALSITNYNSTLNGWANLNVQSNQEIGCRGLVYSPNGLTGRNTLSNTYGWVFKGDAFVSKNLIFVNDNFTLTVNAEPLNYGPVTYTLSSIDLSPSSSDIFYDASGPQQLVYSDLSFTSDGPNKLVNLNQNNGGQVYWSQNFSFDVFTSIVCFLEGSKILTDNGYKLIQDLRKGDLVKTSEHDFKAIDMIGKKEIYHPALQERIKDQLYKCSQSEYPEIFEPLIITGSHAILVDDFINEEQKQKVIEVSGDIHITDNKYRLPACADPRTSVYEISGMYTIYHLALENNDYYENYGIYANGLLVETCSKRYLKELSNMTLIE